MTNYPSNGMNFKSGKEVSCSRYVFIQGNTVGALRLRLLCVFTQDVFVLESPVPPMAGGRGDGPEFAAKGQHELPSGSTIQVTAGTCSLDGWWKSAKDNMKTTSRKLTQAMHRKLRQAQWCK